MLCAPQPGSLGDKLGVHSMHLSYVHATFVATVVGYQDTFYENEGQQPNKVIPHKSPIMLRQLSEVELYCKMAIADGNVDLL